VQNMTKEERLTILLARQCLTGTAALTKANELLLQGVDWEQLWDIANKQNVVPLVAYHIINEPALESVPMRERQKAKSMHFVFVQQEHQYMDGLKTIKSWLDGIDISFIPLKGASYFDQVYKKPGLRACGDYDILIRKEDFMIADRFFRQSFAKGHLSTFTEDELIHFLKYESHMTTFQVYDPFNALIELHVGNWYYSNLDITCFFENTHRVDDIDYVDLVYLFLVTCAHAWHHHDEMILMLGKLDKISLRMLVDIRECWLKIQQQGMEDDLYEAALKHNMLHITGNFLQLAQRVLGEMEIAAYWVNDIMQIQYDWISEFVNVPYEQVLMRPLQMHQEIKQRYRTYHETHNPTIIATHISTTNRALSYYASNTGTPPSYFWPNHGYYPSQTVGHEISMLFTLQWDAHSMYLHATCIGDSCIEPNYNSFNYFCSHLMLIVNHICERPNRLFYFQPKIAEIPAAYTLHMEDEVPTYFLTDYQAYLNGDIFTEYAHNQFTVKAKIPWADLGIDIESHKHIYIDIGFAFRGNHPIFRHNLFYTTGCGNDWRFNALAQLRLES